MEILLFCRGRGSKIRGDVHQFAAGCLAINWLVVGFEAGFLKAYQWSFCWGFPSAFSTFHFSFLAFVFAAGGRGGRLNTSTIGVQFVAVDVWAIFPLVGSVMDSKRSWFALLFISIIGVLVGVGGLLFVPCFLLLFSFALHFNFFAQSFRNLMAEFDDVLSGIQVWSIFVTVLEPRSCLEISWDDFPHHLLHRKLDCMLTERWRSLLIWNILLAANSWLWPSYRSSPCSITSFWLSMASPPKYFELTFRIILMNFSHWAALVPVPWLSTAPQIVFKCSVQRPSNACPPSRQSFFHLPSLKREFFLQFNQEFFWVAVLEGVNWFFNFFTVYFESGLDWRFVELCVLNLEDCFRRMRRIRIWFFVRFHGLVSTSPASLAVASASVRWIGSGHGCNWSRSRDLSYFDRSVPFSLD